MRHRFFTAAMLSYVMLVVVGCGIPSFPFLAPVESPTVFAGSVQFVSPAQSQTDVIRGIEVYYRLYPREVVDDQGERRFFQDLFAADQSLVAVSTTAMPRRLTERGFYRMQSASDSDTPMPPLIPLSTTNRITPTNITVDFAVDPAQVVSAGSTPIDVYRAARSSGESSFLSFSRANSNYEYGNTDVYWTVTGADLQSIAVGLVAFSYGFDPTGFTFVNSEPTFVGVLELP